MSKRPPPGHCLHTVSRCPWERPWSTIQKEAPVPKARAEGEAAGPSCKTRGLLQLSSRSSDSSGLCHSALAVLTLRGHVHIPKCTYTDHPLPQHSPSPIPSSCSQSATPSSPMSVPLHNRALGQH